jgi:hypothetical protein
LSLWERVESVDRHSLAPVRNDSDVAIGAWVSPIEAGVHGANSQPNAHQIDRCDIEPGAPERWTGTPYWRDVTLVVEREACNAPIRFQGTAVTFTFVPRHQLRVVHPRAGHLVEERRSHERIRPLLFWLRERHGSIRAVAMLLEIPEATIKGYVYNSKRKRVPPQAARRIVELMLAHRRTTRPWDMWEELPGTRPVVRLPPAKRRRTRERHGSELRSG